MSMKDLHWKISKPIVSLISVSFGAKIQIPIGSQSYFFTIFGPTNSNIFVIKN